MKRYYISTSDFGGNFDGLLSVNSKGFSTDSIIEADMIFKAESEYLNSHYELAENDGVGYFCSIFDTKDEFVVAISQNYDVK